MPPVWLAGGLHPGQAAPAVSGRSPWRPALYLWGVVRVARRHPARPWPIWRTGMFLAGLAIVVLALCSGIGSYDDILFWDHMIQHLMLIMVAPPLLILGQPITLLLHASRNPLHTWAKRVLRSRPASFLTWPVFGFAAYAAAIVLAAPDRAGQRDRQATGRSRHRARRCSWWSATCSSCPSSGRSRSVAAFLPGQAGAALPGHAGRHLHRHDARLRERRRARPAGRGAPGLGRKRGGRPARRRRGDVGRGRRADVRD